MGFIEIKTKGQKKVFDRIRAISKTPLYEIDVFNKPTYSIYHKTIPGTKGSERQTQPVSKSRTTGQNITILRAQAKKGRNVIYMTPQERQPLVQLIGNAVHAINKKSTQEQLRKATDKIGKAVDKIYENHIKQNKGFRGRLKPNTRETFFRKLYSQSRGPVNDSLRTKLTPLIESGELMRSFTFKVKKILTGGSR